MGVSNGVGDLPQEFEPLAGVELVAVRGETVIEPNRIGIEVAEQQGRAKLVLLVIENRQNVSGGPESG